MPNEMFETDFHIPSREEWEQKILADLKISSLSELQTNTYENISIDSIYTNENRSNHSSDVHQIIKISKEKQNQWDNGSVIVTSDINDLNTILNEQKNLTQKRLF